MNWYLLFSLFILETVRSTFPQPYFDDYAHNVTVTEGKQAILPCQMNPANDKLLVIWLNPKRIVISGQESRYMNDPRISVERPFVGDYNLHIRNVQYDDRGEYICTINTTPVQTHRIRLIVKVPSTFVRDVQPSFVIAKEGETVRLTCNATGIPTPNITWFRRFSSKEEDKEQVGTTGELLIIHNISRNCGGIYECMAFNGVLPAISKNIEVEVRFKPEIAIRNRRLGQKKDKETMLECLVTASPQGDNYWKRGNREIHSSDHGYRYEVYPEDEHTFAISLRILNVQDEDFGVYTCEAKNVLGVASDTMELYEYIEPTFPPTTTTTLSPTTRKYFKNEYKPGEKGPVSHVIPEDDVKRNNHHRQGTQVSGQIGTGEYSNSTGTMHVTFHRLLFGPIVIILIGKWSSS